MWDPFHVWEWDLSTIFSILAEVVVFLIYPFFLLSFLEIWRETPPLQSLDKSLTRPSQTDFVSNPTHVTWSIRPKGSDYFLRISWNKFSSRFLIPLTGTGFFLRRGATHVFKIFTVNRLTGLVPWGRLESVCYCKAVTIINETEIGERCRGEIRTRAIVGVQSDGMTAGASTPSVCRPVGRPGRKKEKSKNKAEAVGIFRSAGCSLWRVGHTIYEGSPVPVDLPIITSVFGFSFCPVSLFLPLYYHTSYCRFFCACVSIPLLKPISELRILRRKIPFM